MDNREKMEWLQQYRACGLEITRLENELVRWRSISEKVSSSVRSAPTGNPAQDRVALNIERIVDLENDLQLQRQRLVELRRAIDQAIATVPYMHFQLVLRYRYIDGLKLRQIAEKMDYSYDSIKQFHKHGLELVKITPNYPAQCDIVVV